MSLNSSDTPTIKRRLTTMIYEGVLLFGVIAIAGLLFSIIFQQRNALYLRHALQYWLFFVVGAYFIWFWNTQRSNAADENMAHPSGDS